MNLPKSPNDKLKGLVISCFDLYENYGNDLLKFIEEIRHPKKPEIYFSIGAPRNIDKEEREKLEREEERKREAEKQKKREKLKSFQNSGREKASYTALKTLRQLEVKCFKNKSIVKKLCQREGIIVKILKTIREKVKQKPSENLFYSAINNSPLLVPTFSEMLVEFMKNKGLESKDVYVAANLDRRLFSKIMTDTYYSPSKETAVYLCLALRLNIDEAEEFLATAGYALSKSKLTDIVIEFFIRTQNYSIEDLDSVVCEIQRIADQELDD